MAPCTAQWSLTKGLINGSFSQVVLLRTGSIGTVPSCLDNLTFSKVIRCCSWLNLCLRRSIHSGQNLPFDHLPPMPRLVQAVDPGVSPLKWHTKAFAMTGTTLHSCRMSWPLENCGSSWGTPRPPSSSRISATMIKITTKKTARPNAAALV